MRIGKRMAAAAQPRWTFRAPTDAAIAAFLRAQTDGGGASPPFSYAEVGASRSNLETPPGYNLDHNRVRIGEGARAFDRAAAALRAWRMFPRPWTRILPADAPIRVGQILTMQAQALGLWWLNACRIVYVIDEAVASDGQGILQRFGFAYGTLPAHVEQGEERFSVELQSDGGVWYDLRAFSRPRYWPVRLAKPLARRLQAKFVRESQAAMQAAVAEEGNGTSVAGRKRAAMST